MAAEVNDFESYGEVESVKQHSESGWERVKKLYHTSDSDLYANVSQAVGMASITGFLLGGKMAASQAGEQHLLANQLTMYPSKMQAHREYHSAVAKGFMRNGCRWGWRMGLFAGIYSAILTIMQEYRDKEDALNFVAAGAATGGTYKLLSGYRGIIVGTILGAGFSLPLAAVVQGFFLLIPHDMKEKYNESKRINRMKVEEKPEEDWEKNLTTFDEMIEKMESELDAEQIKETKIKE